MQSNRRLQIADAADDDLAAIAQYAAATWGEDQADRYVQRIFDALSHLLLFPEIGRKRDELTPGLRSHPVGQHVAYYLVIDNELVVIRFLDRRRDAGAALRG